MAIPAFAIIPTWLRDWRPFLLGCVRRAVWLREPRQPAQTLGEHGHACDVDQRRLGDERTMTLRRLLAVTHEASQTGAPIVFADLLEWIADNTSIDVHVLLLRNGPLRSRFERIGEVTIIGDTAIGSALELAQRGLAARGSRRASPALARLRLKPHLRHLADFDLVYLNSLTSLEVLPYLHASRRVVSHIHELETAIRLWQRVTPDPALLQNVPDAWIAASGAVEQMLVKEFGCPAERVLLHHACIDARSIGATSVPLRELESMRHSLGIPPDAAVVMGSGTIEWRKGPDLFVQLACEVRRRTNRPVHFVWVGGDLDGHDWVRLRTDIERSGADHVHFTGAKRDPIPWFHLADVFVLTSHEDPFPLVCQEHAALGHPVVTFRNGGMPELLESAGSEAAKGVVDHLDISGMATRVIELIASESPRTEAGQQLKARVLRHHDLSVAAPLLAADLERISAGH